MRFVVLNVTEGYTHYRDRLELETGTRYHITTAASTNNVALTFDGRGTQHCPGLQLLLLPMAAVHRVREVHS